MSDEKTSSGKPSTGAPPTGAAFDQEFEKFLSEETARVDAIYRKLPQAEPDAQLDARVRALARAALREASSPALSTPATPTPGVSTPGHAPAHARRRWMPAFASAAVLVLAAGLAWRMGPQNNWTQKDAASSVALDATTPSNASATGTVASSPSVATAAPPPPATDAGGYAAAAKSVGEAPAKRADATDAPVPFPAAKPVPPGASGGAPASAAQAELRKAEAPRSAGAAASRSAGSPISAREKSVPANVAAARGELQPASPANATALPPGSASTRTGANAATNSALAESAAALSAPKPAPIVAETHAQDTQEAKAAKSPPPAPPDVARATASARSLTTPAPQQAPADARRRDGVATEPAQQGAAEIADRSAPAAAKARLSASAPPAAPPPPPMQAPVPVTGFASEPSPVAAAPTSNPPASAAAGTDEEAQKQSHADQLALPAGSPQANIPGRPTAAQLAAWPAPNCRAAGTGTADAHKWNYPPDVPASAQLRFATVKTYLDLDSREGALKAYADFRHCYPDDRWPAALLQRLGTQ